MSLELLKFLGLLNLQPLHLVVLDPELDMPSPTERRACSNPRHPPAFFRFFFRRASVLSPAFFLDFLAELYDAAIAICRFFFRLFPSANVGLSNVSAMFSLIVSWLCPGLNGIRLVFQSHPQNLVLVGVLVFLLESLLRRRLECTHKRLEARGLPDVLPDKLLPGRG